MNNYLRKSLYLITICLTIAICIVLIVLGIAFDNQSKNPEKWQHRSYGNGVALFKGKTIEEVYGNIVFDNLPKDDRRQLENGIAFSTKEEAVSAIEDYDG